MPHIRTQVRDAAVAALTGLASTGARVFANRLRVLTAADLPCVLVNTDDEVVDYVTMHEPALLERTLELTVRGVARAVSGLDVVLDQIALEVEQALATSLLGGLIKDAPTLVRISFEDEALLDKPVGVITLTFAIKYQMASGSPDVAL